MSTEDPEVQARSLWIGEMEQWMDEEFIEKRLLEHEIPVKSVKVIRNRMKGVSLGYGFIEFFSTTQASDALAKLNNKAILKDNQTFKLNWASDSQSKIACFGGLPKNEFTIYVGELNANISEEQLKMFFMKHYTSVLGAKIVINPVTKKSKGYGFVKFSEQEESKRAIVEMNGKEMFGKFIKVNQASFKKVYEIQGNTGNNRKNSSSNATAGICSCNNNCNLNDKVSTMQSNQQGSMCNGNLSPQLISMSAANSGSVGNHNVMMHFNYVDMNAKVNDAQCQRELPFSPSITRENLNMFYIQKDSGNNSNTHINSKNYIEKEKYMPNGNNVYPKYNLIDFYMGQGDCANYFPHLHQFQINNCIHNSHQQKGSNTQS